MNGILKYTLKRKSVTFNKFYAEEIVIFPEQIMFIEAGNSYNPKLIENLPKKFRKLDSIDTVQVYLAGKSCLIIGKISDFVNGSDPDPKPKPKPKPIDPDPEPIDPVNDPVRYKIVNIRAIPEKEFKEKFGDEFGIFPCFEITCAEPTIHIIAGPWYEFGGFENAAWNRLQEVKMSGGNTKIWILAPTKNNKPVQTPILRGTEYVVVDPKEGPGK